MGCLQDIFSVGEEVEINGFDGDEDLCFYVATMWCGPFVIVWVGFFIDINIGVGFVTMTAVSVCVNWESILIMFYLC